MFSKAVITFLAIGALWVNVLATPIPAGWGRAGKDPYSRPPALYSESEGSPPTTPPTSYADTDSHMSNPGVLAIGPPPQPNLEESSSKGKKLAIYGGELPRSFSALSYRDLTFVFSVGGGLVTGSIGATITYLAFHNHTRREFGLESKDSNSVTLLPVIKREPMSEDGTSDSLSSPLKREPEPASPSL